MSARRALAAVTPRPVKQARRGILALAPLPGLARRTRLRAGFAGGGEAPLVSVVIATYNWSSVLRYSVASALAQTYPQLEVVVVGDACTDDSEQVVASFGDPRVRWLNLPENSGSQSVPNNAGIEAARGEYIAYLGHDDLWLPSHLSLVLTAILRNRADMGYAVAEQLGPRGSGHRELRAAGEVDPRYVPPSALVHRKGLVDEVGPWRDYRTISAPPDMEFIGRACDHGARLAASGALTVLKFPSTFRRNSYVDKPSEDQERYSRRMQTERGFVARELAALAFGLVRAQFRPPLLPEFPEPPDPLPPGWVVREFRRIRGLEP